MVRRGIFALLLLALAGIEASASIPWRADLDEASAVARETNRPVLVDFWADWCGPCIVMEREVFTDERVARAMTKVIPVRVHVDKVPDLVRKYEVLGPPTMVVLDAYGTELFRFTGQLGATTFLALLDELPGDLTSIHEFAHQLVENDRSVSALAGLARELRSARLYRASNEYYRRALRTREGRGKTPERGEMLIASGANWLALKDGVEAAKAFEQYLKDFPSGPLRAEATAGLERARAARR